jgi:hypothetical protein
MPWETTEKFIHSGHRPVEDFQKDTLKTVTIDENDGIQAVMGKPLGKETMEIQSYLFPLDKGWTLGKAQEWFQKHNQTKEHVYALLPFVVTEKMVDKPLKIRGLAMTAGISRNFNIYTPTELQTFAGKLVNAPVYMEHVTATNSVGKVTKTEWDGHNLLYEAEIYDDEIAGKIRAGLIRHVSVGADYESVDIVNGKVPHGLFNAEMSLVAVPGIAETNIHVVEKLTSPAAEPTPSSSPCIESLIKKPQEKTIPISQAVKLIEQVLPNPLVQRSWSLGPQRMCQELQRTILKLRSLQDSHEIDHQ